MSEKKKLLAVEPLMAVIFWGYAFSGIAVALQSGFEPQAIVALRMVIAAIGFVALYASGYIDFELIRLRDWPRLLLLTGIWMVRDRFDRSAEYTHCIHALVSSLGKASANNGRRV